MRFAVLVMLGCSQPTPHDNDRPVTPPADATRAVPADFVSASVDAMSVDAAPVPPPMVDAPVKWSAARERLTLDYRRQHSDPAATDLAITPRVIILHYTAGGSAKGTRDYMDNLKIEPGRPELARAGAVNVSSHYLVDRDGTIYKLQPDTRFARHCIGLNHVAIGVENVGDDKKWPLTDAQVTADAALVRYLATSYPITHLLGHYEAMSFRKHAYYVERDPSYKNDKPDPGPEFMRRVRAEVADLKLSGL